MTHCENTSGNVLDLVYTNMPALTLVTSADMPLIADHQQDKAHVPLHCMIECEPSVHTPSHSLDKIYCFKKAHFNLIRDAIANVDYETLFADKNVDEMVHAFYASCYEIFEEHVPKASPVFQITQYGATTD